MASSTTAGTTVESTTKSEATETSQLSSEITTIKPTAATIPSTRITVQGPDGGPVVYSSECYGFRITLPASWRDYSVIDDDWRGYALTGQQSGTVTESGPILSIRHPLWTAEIPRQDIPVMIFTLAQWTDLQNEQISVGAAPVPPSELGRNQRYVFALPARYNYAFPVGFEEVEEILKSNPLEPFDP